MKNYFSSKRFLRKNFDKKFSQSKFSIQKWQCFLQSCFLSFFFLIILIHSAIQKSSFNEKIFEIVFLLKFSIISFFFYKMKSPNSLIYLFQFTSNVGMAILLSFEIKKNYLFLNNSKNLFYLGIFAGIYHVVMLKNTSGIISFIHFFFIFLTYFIVLSLEGIEEIILILLIVILVFRSFVNQVQVRLEKEKYFKDSFQKKNNLIWKNLMIDLHPGVVAIIKRGSESFHNNKKFSLQSEDTPTFLPRLAKKTTFKLDQEQLYSLDSVIGEEANSWRLDEINNFLKNKYKVTNTNEFVKWINKIKIIKKSNTEMNNVFDVISANFEKPFFTTMEVGNSSFYVTLIGVIEINDNYKEKVLINICLYDEESMIFKCQTIDSEEEIYNLIELNKYKDRLIANVSHDFRTPLIGINFMIDKARNCKDNEEEFNKCLNIAKTNSDLLMYLVSDMLDYTQIKENRIKINADYFSIDDFLEDIYLFMNIQAELKKIKLEIINEMKGKSIKNDERRIKQILINLISNSLKFTLEGKITVKISEEGDEFVKINVRDTGSGIKSEIVDKIFEPYISYNNESNLNRQGIGIGLHICKSIVKYIGPKEKINVESEIGKFTNFSFLIYKNLLGENMSPKSKFSNSFCNEIPNIKIRKFSESSIEKYSPDYFKEMDSSEKISKNIPKQNLFFRKKQNFDKLKKYNILIADDQVFNLYVLSEILKSIDSYQFELLEAQNGQIVVDIFKKNNREKSNKNVDIIFLDWEMPVLNGPEAAKIIKNLVQNEGYIDCIIVGYSCYCNENYEMVESMDFTLVKPSNKKEFETFFRNLNL